MIVYYNVRRDLRLIPGSFIAVISTIKLIVQSLSGRGLSITGRQRRVAGSKALPSVSLVHLLLITATKVFIAPLASHRQCCCIVSQPQFPFPVHRTFNPSFKYFVTGDKKNSITRR